MYGKRWTSLGGSSKPLRTLHLPSRAVMLFLGCFVDDKWQSRLRILSNYTVLCGFCEI